MTQEQQIQEHLMSLVQDPGHAITEKAGVIAKINLHEGGWNAPEGSFAGITEVAWDEFCEDNPSIEHDSPAQFQELPADIVATYISYFTDWYFTHPGKRDFWALPKLLWFVYCDAAFPAPVPVIRFVQQLVGLPAADCDGIWGSGTTAAVQAYFEGKTTTDILMFARDFTDLVNARYADLGKREKHADVAPKWITRATNAYQELLEYVQGQQEAEETEEEATPVEDTPTEDEEDSRDEESEPDIPPAEKAAALAVLEALQNDVGELAINVVKLSDTVAQQNEVVGEVIDLQRQLLEDLGNATKPKLEVPNLGKSMADKTEEAKKVLEQDGGESVGGLPNLFPKS
ncbi:hypothetical protein F4212_01340 [Candidatus Poribacteria bacterium]|nr:hypothetical protein [Candidatus Poribacteria bacterium]